MLEGLCHSRRIAHQHEYPRLDIHSEPRSDGRRSQQPPQACYRHFLALLSIDYAFFLKEVERLRVDIWFSGPRPKNGLPRRFPTLRFPRPCSPQLQLLESFLGRAGDWTAMEAQDRCGARRIRARGGHRLRVRTPAGTSPTTRVPLAPRLRHLVEQLQAIETSVGSSGRRANDRGSSLSR